MTGFTRATEIGKITILEENGAVIRVLFEEDAPRKYEENETPLVKSAFSQLDEYLSGNRRVFDLPLKPAGTEYQLAVWDKLRGVAYGETVSYAQLANDPRHARAAGMCCNRNPIPVFIPCHRVVGKNGALTGYRGGIALKKKLLMLEHGNI